MKITKVIEGKEYPTTGHYDMRCLRLHGTDTSDCKDFTLGISHFLPGGKTDYMPAGVELIYLVVEGELTLTADGKEYTLGKYDSVHFSIGDEKAIENRTNMPASMFVIAGTPK